MSKKQTQSIETSIAIRPDWIFSIEVWSQFFKLKQRREEKNSFRKKSTFFFLFNEAELKECRWTQDGWEIFMTESICIFAQKKRTERGEEKRWFKTSVLNTVNIYTHDVWPRSRVWDFQQLKLGRGSFVEMKEKKICQTSPFRELLFFTDFAYK